MMRPDPTDEDLGLDPWEQDDGPPTFRRADRALEREPWGDVTIRDDYADDIDF